ncbi:MAG: DMT family transporter [Gammaproteobacteria bacterium]|nr:DMT family transporter [Gammaproteobacteria bacterium]
MSIPGSSLSSATDGGISYAGVGILCASLAWFAFSINDLSIKYLSDSMPLHQIILFRSAIALVFTLCVFLPLEGGFQLLKTRHLKIHIFRGVCLFFANMLFFIGLTSLSLPEATAIFFVAPLFITALSAIVLHEQVGIYRWGAVCIGLVGVLVMLEPQSGSINYYALFPLISAFAYAVTQILTRKIGFQDKASTMAFYVQLTFIVICTAFGILVGDGRFSNPDSPAIDFLFRSWVYPERNEYWILVLLGLCSGVGGYLISQAYRVAESAVIAPFEYVALLFSVLWSVLIFSEWPTFQAWTGIGLILCSGLFVFWREVVVGRPFVVEHPMPRNR